MKTSLHLFGMVLSLCATATVARARETRASLSGTVTDQSGSVVSGITMRLTSVETSVVFTVTANPVGQYGFLFLHPGKYKLIAEMAGFKTFDRDNIELSVSATTALPVRPEVRSHSDIPTGRNSSKLTPDGTRDAVLAAFKAGSEGVILSRKWSGMKTANLSGAGAANSPIGIWLIARSSTEVQA